MLRTFNKTRWLLYIFFDILFGDTLTSNKTLFGVMSGKLSFIFGRLRICKTFKYIDQTNKSSWRVPGSLLIGGLKI